MKKIKNLVNAALKKANLDRFSFAQMTSNSDGKTSGSGSMGVFIIAVGLITFLMGAIHFLVVKEGTIMMQSIVIISIGTGLLGYRKSKDGKVTRDAVTAPHDEFTDEPAEPEDMSGGDDGPIIPLNS